MDTLFLIGPRATIYNTKTNKALLSSLLCT